MAQGLPAAVEISNGAIGARNVLLVIRWPVGGIRTFVKYLVKFFPSTEVSFSVLGPDEPEMRMLQVELGDLISEWIFVNADGKEQSHIFFELRRLKSKRSFDLIHCQGFTSAALCVASGLNAVAPLVLTSHDVINESQFSGIFGFAKKLIMAYVLDKCAMIQSVSFDAHDNLLSYFPNNVDKSVVVKNGVDTKSLEAAVPVKLKYVLGLNKDTVLIGFFGRFMSQKGFRFLVEAVEILVERRVAFDLKVVCFGMGAFIREEKEALLRKDLMQYFEFREFVAEVGGFMKGCDLIVMPSLWEACPLQPMEALCAGVPFVGTECIGLREVLKETPAVKVKPADSESLADGILECLEKGREPFVEFVPEASSRFDVNITAKGIYEIYRLWLR